MNDKPKRTASPSRENSFIFSRRPRPGVLHGTFERAVGRAGVIALHPIAGLLVGGGLGMYLQRQYALGGWIFWVLLLAGGVAGLRNARFEYRAMLREQEEDAR